MTWLQECSHALVNELEARAKVPGTLTKQVLGSPNCPAPCGITARLVTLRTLTVAERYRKHPPTFHPTPMARGCRAEEAVVHSVFIPVCPVVELGA